jgi:hypothetical protein
LADIPEANQRGSRDFDASQHRRERSNAEEIVHPADERTVHNERLNAHRLVVSEFHRADPREDHDQAPTDYLLANVFNRDNPFDRGSYANYSY